MILSENDIINFKDQGFIKKLFFNKDQCNFYRKHFEKLAKNYKNSHFEGKLKDRIMNPHFFDEISRKIILMPKFFSFASQLLNSEVYGVQTMFFRRGSEQKHHQDDFYLNRTIGFWIALDNVDENNGTLCLQKKSQNFKVLFAEDLGIKNPQHLGDDVSYAKKIFEIYNQNKKHNKLNNMIVKLKKGEGLIIDGRLIHWGLPVKNEKKKRRVFVLHYLEQNSIWPYKNWPLYLESGEYKIDGFFDKNNLHPNEI